MLNGVLPLFEARQGRTEIQLSLIGQELRLTLRVLAIRNDSQGCASRSTEGFSMLADLMEGNKLLASSINL